MKNPLIILAMALLLPLSLQAKKPTWVSRGVASLNAKRTNTTYTFQVVGSVGPNLQQLRNDKASALAERVGERNHIEGTATTSIENKQLGQDVQTKSTFRMDFTNSISSSVFYARLVDEYWERASNGDYHYYALFAVSENDHPVFDEFSTTSNYGAAPVAMSIIPGLGQIYKGSTVKGVALFAGTAACGLGALLCENQRSDYKNKMKEQPRFAQDYNTKASNWETGRNICLGAAAAVWVYNLVDAAVAKGARRIKVSKAGDRSLSVMPVPTPEGAVVSLAYHF